MLPLIFKNARERRLLEEFQKIDIEQHKNSTYKNIELSYVCFIVCYHKQNGGTMFDNFKIHSNIIQTPEYTQSNHFI